MKTLKLFWLADKAFAAHSALTLAALAGSLWDGAFLWTGMFLALWVLAWLIWMEWKNS